MKVFLPANTRQLEERKKLFDMDVCVELKKKGVKFGFEIKGLIGKEGVKTDLPYGIHLPYDFVSMVCKNESRKWAENLILLIADQNPAPDYVVLHGRRVGDGRQPSSREKRFISTVGPDDYERALDQTVKVVQELKRALPSVRVAIENTPFTDIFQREDSKPPVLETCLCLRVGNLTDSLISLRQAAGCDIVLDFEHLSFAFDFAQRSGIYDKLEGKIPSDLSVEEGELIKKCGLFLRKEFVPVVPAPFGILEEEVELTRANIYHFSGSSPVDRWEEIYEGKVAFHSPILPDDKNVIRMLKFLKRIQLNKDLTFVLEVCGSKDIPSNKHPEIWTARSANAQRESLKVFCQMLLDIWCL